ncbi:MAG TPA: type II CAAX endopeptidase family protein [Ktedonobacterales bacterium]
MSLGRRILLFPLTLLLIAAVLLAGSAIAIFALLDALKVPSGPLTRESVLAGCALLTLIVVGRLIERRTFAELGFGRGFLRDMGVGLALGASIISLVIGLLALFGWYQVIGPGALVGAGLATNLSVILLFLLVAVFEEITFRGLLFRIVENGLGSWGALIVSAVLFGGVHLGNPGATIGSSIAIALEAGVLLGAIYMATRSLWMVIGVHWAWNYFEGPVFGTQVSGNDIPSLLHSVTNGPVLWTGGAFGPEAGLFAVIAGGIVGATFIWLAIRRGQVIAPMWTRRSTSLPAQPSTAAS